jgi:hypothetical protein
MRNQPPQPVPLVVKYEEILQLIHEDKMKNKPGVYTFISHSSSETICGFIIGKETLFTTPSGAKVSHLLEVLYHSQSFAVGRIDLPLEKIGLVIGKLRGYRENLAKVSPAQGYELVRQECEPFLECASLVSGPDDLYALMKLLFEHRGE